MAGGACGGTIANGPMPPSVVWGAVRMAGSLPPCVATGPAWLVTMGGGNWIMTVCMIVLGSFATLWVTSYDVDMGPLAKIRPENGSRFAVAMGLDGTVWRSGSD